MYQVKSTSDALNSIQQFANNIQFNRMRSVYKDVASIQTLRTLRLCKDCSANTCTYYCVSKDIKTDDKQKEDVDVHSCNSHDILAKLIEKGCKSDWTSFKDLYAKGIFYLWYLPNLRCIPRADTYIQLNR